MQWLSLLSRHTSEKLTSVAASTSACRAASRHRSKEELPSAKCRHEKLTSDWAEEAHPITEAKPSCADGARSTAEDWADKARQATIWRADVVIINGIFAMEFAHHTLKFIIASVTLLHLHQV